MDALYESDVPGLTLIGRGKVRDIYDAGEHLAIVASDRISCFDVVLPTPVPGKGRLLTALSVFWFDLLAAHVSHHLVTAELAEMPAPLCDHPELAGRTMLVRKCAVLPVECIVRGHVAGSGWADYQRTGAICGVPLPSGLREFERLPEPIFTPSTKAPKGGKDENISFDVMVDTIGAERAEAVRERSLAVYRTAAAHAAARGLILADTKLEWGTAGDELVLIDEVLTPDSSRFWPADGVRVGEAAPSLDKQFVRDWLLATGWDRQPPAPALPDDVIARTVERYQTALRRLTGEPCD